MTDLTEEELAAPFEEEAPKLELSVKKRTSVSINAKISLDNVTLRVQSQKEGIKLEVAKKIKSGYYNSRTKTLYTIIPDDMVEYALEALQAVVDARAEAIES